jgi:hypothetical protein
MIGRRLLDTPDGQFPLPYDDLQPGDAWKVLDRDTGEPLIVTDQPSNLTGAAWFIVAPGPGEMKLLANLRAHTVREHDDGTISVRPGDGSSNSILVTRRPEETWHGFIEHNVWTAC